MATRAAMAEMDDLARKRIAAASAQLAERHNVAVPEIAFERNPQMRQIRELEAHATFLESLLGDPASADALATDAAPVVVTEAIDGKTAKQPASRKKA